MYDFPKLVVLTSHRLKVIIQGIDGTCEIELRKSSR